MKKKRLGKTKTLCESCYHLCGGCAGIPIEKRTWVQKFIIKKLTTSRSGKRYYAAHRVIDCSRYRRGRKPLSNQPVESRAKQPRYKYAAKVRR